MKKFLGMCGLLVIGFSAALFINDNGGQTQAAAAKAKAPMVAHCVYFSLKDNSAESKQKLVDACKELLSGHEGTSYFAAGPRAEDSKGAFNDTDYDVALVIAFKDKESLGTYAKSSRHLQFISENRDTFSGVRVFDAYYEPTE